MENIIKPSFVKTKGTDPFLQLRKEVNEIVKALEPERKRNILLKAVVFPLAYIATYVIALIYGNNVNILYICYFLLGCFFAS